VIAAAQDRVDGRAGLTPALAAARARLGLVAVLFALAGLGWWSTIDRMRARSVVLDAIEALGRVRRVALEAASKFPLRRREKLVGLEDRSSHRMLRR